MVRNEYWLKMFPTPDEDNFISILATEFLPSDMEVESVLFVLHGMTEHMQRYEKFAQNLTSKSIAVIGFDLPGHGASKKAEGNCASFGKGNWMATVDFTDHFITDLKKKYSCPIYLMGFSLGSFLARDYLNQYSSNIEGAIIMGTGTTSKMVLNIVKALVNKEANKIGFDETSKFIKKLSFDTYNKKIKNSKTECDWLCSDEISLQEYINDPLCVQNISAGLFGDLLSSMNRNGGTSQYKTWNKNIRILIISGTEDPVGGFTKGVTKVYKKMVNSGIVNIQFFLLPGRHDVLHEIQNKTAAIATDKIVKWMETSSL